MSIRFSNNEVEGDLVESSLSGVLDEASKVSASGWKVKSKKRILAHNSQNKEIQRVRKQRSSISLVTKIHDKIFIFNRQVGKDGKLISCHSHTIGV